MAMIAAVAWDLGNVLAAFSHRRACEQLATLTQGRHDADEVHDWVFASGRHVQLEEGALAPEAFLAALGTRFQIAAPVEAVARAYSDIFTPALAVCELVRRLPPTLPQLLASNTDPLHWGFVAPLLADVLDVLRHAVLSFEVGARKPGGTFFTALVARAGCRPEQLLFIDDLPANVEGARAVGIDAVLFESAAGVERELARRGLVTSSAWCAPGS
jgi:putative hydrolase of the HAD superfamily